MGIYTDLVDRVAVVTGSGREAGLGFAIAERLAQEGCRVVLSDLGTPQGPNFPAEAIGTESELERLVARLRARGTECLGVRCDLRDPDSVEALIATTVSQFGRIDILVNNAGIGYLMKPVLELDVAEWDAVLDVNLRGVFLASKAAARHMIAQGHGRIINIASQAAKSGFPYASAYCASKHGLVGLTRVCAIEWGRHGITVNAVCPNHVTTGLGAWQNEYFSKALGMTLEQYLAAMRQRIPLGRPGLQADTANACAWLASAQAAYVTGEALNVSGGEEYH